MRRAPDRGRILSPVDHRSGIGVKAALALAVGLICLDQATKMLVAASLAPGAEVDLAPFLRLVHWRNKGAAFGLGRGLGGPWLMIGLSAVGSVALAGWLIKFTPADAPGRWGLALALGGAVGNLIDRALYGMVTDFIFLHWRAWHWPAFNVADMALSLGFGLVAYSVLTRPARG